MSNSRPPSWRRWFRDGRVIRPQEEQKHRPRTGRNMLWFPLELPSGVAWYAPGHYYRGLLGWVEFPNLRAHELEPSVWEEMIMSVLRKAPAKGANGPPRFTPSKEEAKRFPGLIEHLTADRWPETGEARKTSTLTLFYGPQGLTGIVSDKENGCGCFASANGLVALLDALEAAVQSPDTVWREDKNATGGSARVKR